jgi:hypothetical protein
MQDTNPPDRPYTLWEETLRNGVTARLIIYPSETDVLLVLFKNRLFHSYYKRSSREEAERRAWDLREELLNIGDLVE